MSFSEYSRTPEGAALLSGLAGSVFGPLGAIPMAIGYHLKRKSNQQKNEQDTLNKYHMHHRFNSNSNYLQHPMNQNVINGLNKTGSLGLELAASAVPLLLTAGLVYQTHKENKQRAYIKDNFNLVLEPKYMMTENHPNSVMHHQGSHYPNNHYPTSYFPNSQS